MDSYIVTVQDVLMLQNRERYMDAVEAVVNQCVRAWRLGRDAYRYTLIINDIHIYHIHHILSYMIYDVYNIYTYMNCVVKNCRKL